MKNKFAVARLTESSLATIYGCCGIFDLCADNDIMSLSFQEQEPLLDWIGWESSDVCLIKKEFIAWVRPEYSGGAATAGYLADPCAEPNGIEWGKCDFTLNDFGRLRRKGPTRDITENDERYCETQPRYRLDGTLITDDREFDMRWATEIIMQDLKRLLVIGNNTTGGQFDGFERLVKTGYTNSDGKLCQLMDSVVVDWNSNSLDGGAGVTVNGAAIPATYDFIDVLLDVFRNIRQRIRWSPQLNAQRLRVGDIVLVMTEQMTRCLLDAYTCWSVCPGVAFNEANLNTFEARTFRDNLNGGMFGAGRIFLDGFEIPLLPYDWELQKGPNRSDVYMLTSRIGNVELLQGQYLNMNNAGNSYPESATPYFASDGGRLLTWTVNDETCIERRVELRPRILSWAPWTNVRFQDVRCNTPLGPLSPDPTETSFFPLTSFEVAEC